MIDPNSITDIHVIFSNHLDFGFTDYWFNVLNKYWYEFFLDPNDTPHADKTSRNVEGISKYFKDVNNVTMHYLTHSYLLDLFFNCPPNMHNIKCPNQKQINRTKTLLLNKYLVFHAFPFNSQLSLYDAKLFEFGLHLTKQITKTYNAHLPKVLSQRDVPGMTRSLIPILIQNNITAISVGVNYNSPYPDLPENDAVLLSKEALIFRWLDPISNEEILALWNPGYGNQRVLSDLKQVVLLENFTHAIAFQFDFDNDGPDTSGFMEDSLYKRLGSMFSNANIYPSTFEAYTDVLLSPSNKDIYNNIPVVDKEIGDTWIHGIASDPLKLAFMRIAQRKRTICILNNLCSNDDYIFYNFSRFLLKSGEHTFGISVNAKLQPSQSLYVFNNVALRNALKYNNDIKILVNSWNYQREIVIDYSLNALLQATNDSYYHTLYTDIISEFNTIKYPKIPDVSDQMKYKLIPNTTTNSFNIYINDDIDYSISFNPFNGALDFLYDEVNDIDYINENVDLDVGFVGFGGFLYQTRTEKDFEDFFIRNYSYDKGIGGECVSDFCKPGLDSNVSFIEHQDIFSNLVDIYRDTENDNVFIIEMDFGNDEKEQSYLIDNYGIPERVYVQYDFSSIFDTNYHGVINNNDLDDYIGFSIQVSWIYKTFTKIPESLWLIFSPNYNINDILIEKYNQMISVSSSNILINGSQHLHCVNSNGMINISYNNSLNQYILIQPIDTGLVGIVPNEYDTFTPFPTPVFNTTNNLNKGIGFNLFNNIWNTNYPQYYPFNENDTNSTFRFNVFIKKHYYNSRSTTTTKTTQTSKTLLHTTDTSIGTTQENTNEHHPESEKESEFTYSTNILVLVLCSCIVIIAIIVCVYKHHKNRQYNTYTSIMTDVEMY